MGKTKGIGIALGLAALGVTLTLAGCQSTPNGDGQEAEYNLVVVLERNLQLNQDIIYLRFRRDNSGISGGVVVVDGDTITTLPASGNGAKTYNGGRWTDGGLIRITALDTSNSFVYRDSILMPFSFLITNVVPANRLWQGGTVRLDWSGSNNATDYAVSVKPRSTSSSARGLGTYDTDGTELTESFAGNEVFSTSLGVVIPDVYDMQVIAYSRNFVARSSPPYKIPDNADIREPIGRTNIDGAISALTVTERDTILVPQIQ